MPVPPEFLADVFPGLEQQLDRLIASGTASRTALDTGRYLLSLRDVYIQAAARVIDQLPLLAPLRAAPFNSEAFADWAHNVVLPHVAARAEARKPIDVAALLAENRELRERLIELEQVQGHPTPVSPSVQVPALSGGNSVAEVLSDWDMLADIRERSVRQLNLLQAGLGQRICRIRRVVCCGLLSHLLGLFCPVPLVSASAVQS